MPIKPDKLVTRESFIEVWTTSRNSFPNYHEAYETLETVREAKYGERLYSNYNSFKRCLSYHHKK